MRDAFQCVHPSNEVSIEKEVEDYHVIFRQKLQPKYKKLSLIPSSLLHFHTKLASYNNNCPGPQIKQPRGHPPPSFHQELNQRVL